MSEYIKKTKEKRKKTNWNKEKEKKQEKNKENAYVIYGFMSVIVLFTPSLVRNIVF